MNPQPTDLESVALPLELLPYTVQTLFDLFVFGMAAAMPAILGGFSALRVFAFIFRRRVIPSTAFRTFHINNRLHLPTPQSQ